MNLIEAVKTKKEFSRVTGDIKIVFLSFEDSRDLPYKFTREDVLSKDWEIRSDEKIHQEEKCFNCGQSLDEGFFKFKGVRYCLDCGEKPMGLNGKEIPSEEKIEDLKLKKKKLTKGQGALESFVVAAVAVWCFLETLDNE